MKPDESEVRFIGLVVDKHGRICIDRSVFFDECKLNEIVEAVKNGCDS